MIKQGSPPAHSPVVGVLEVIRVAKATTAFATEPVAVVFEGVLGDVLGEVLVGGALL